MGFYERTLVTVICESTIENQVVDVAKKHGVVGHTTLDARGDGARGVRGGDFEYDKNVKIEFLCKAEVAEDLCLAVQKKFFENYAIIAYKSNVSVLRDKKF